MEEADKERLGDDQDGGWVSVFLVPAHPSSPKKTVVVVVEL